MEYEIKEKDISLGKPESEENFRFLSSFAHDAIIQINEYGLIIYWNKSAERHFGLSETDVLNKDLHNLIVPERYLGAFKKAFAKFRISGEGAAINKTLELEGRRSNGEEFPIELSLSSFQVNGEWNAVGIIRDISERKTLEAKLIDSETKHREIINNLDVAFYQLLLGGTLLNHNPAFNFILGYDPSLDLKNTNVELLWENPELRKIYLKQLLKEGYVKNYVCHAIKKDGSKAVLQLNSHVIRDKEGKPVRIDGTFIDITEKFVLEKKLIESEENFRTITEDSHLVITILQDDVIIYTNQKMADLFCYEREEMLTWTPKEYAKTIAEDSLEFVMEQTKKKQIGDPDVKLQYPIHCVKSSGEKFWVDNISTTIIYKGRPADLITFIDTTEKRKAEEKLKESEETYHSLFNNSLSGIAFHKITYTPNGEPINYMITDVNPMFEKILHLKKENVINILVTEAYGVEEPPYFEIYSNVAETMKSESFSGYYKPMDKFFKISAFSFERGKFVTVFEDITEEKLMEIELKKAHSELDEIFNLTVPIYVTDSNYIITQANESLISLLNLKKDDIIGKKCYDIWHNPRCNNSMCSLRQHMQGIDVKEYEIEKEIGLDSKLSLLIRSTVHRNLNGEIVTVFKSIVDITLRKKTEERLKRTLETTRKVLEALPMGIILVDKDETIQSVNKTALNLLGYENEFEILGKDWYENIRTVEENASPIPDHGKGREQTEVSLKCKLGNEVPVLKSVLPISLGDMDYLLEAFVDITSLKEIQKKLKESQEKYLDLIETSTLGILEINLIENKIEYVNPALLDITECSLNDIKAENVFYEMLHPEDRSLLTSSLEKRDVEFRILLREGTIKWVVATRLFTYDINQKPINLRLWMTEITERKKSERLKEKFTERLEREIEYRTKDLKDLLEKQRLYLDQIEKISRFKTEFLATMSHELRTPLNAIIGFTDLLIEGVFGELNKEQSEYIKDIDDSSKHLLDIITHILDISKIESGQVALKIEEIQLNNMIDQVISTLKPLYAKKDIKWELVGLKKEHFIFADRIKFKQIIYNLLSNAIKFTQKGKIIFEFKENKKEWEFFVKDTGIGISEKDFDIIFKDFKRVKSDYVDATQGTGLGLALTKRLINIHGGIISFSSKLEKGTTFTFNLPKNLKEKSTNVIKVASFLKKL